MKGFRFEVQFPVGKKTMVATSSDKGFDIYFRGIGAVAYFYNNQTFYTKSDSHPTDALVEAAFRVALKNEQLETYETYKSSGEHASYLGADYDEF